MKDIRVVIAEDQKIMIEAYKKNLEADGLTVKAVFENGIDLIEWLKNNEVDVIVLDVEMPKMDGIEVAKYFVKNKLDYKILIVSAHHSPSFVSICKDRYNIKGFITKAYCHLELTEGVIALYEGETYFSQMPVLENAETSYIKQKMIDEKLSDGEKDLLPMLAEYTFKEISQKKGVSYKTVVNTFARIRNKLGINSPVELAKILLDKEQGFK
ncbi:response regulator transcription factor [Tenacibaculum sp. 190524A02b]|uniref:response regulator transcription factor n=1 Tax=Tenacibaculum vairaonense TaxID=3137860 RepID=UPI0031FA9258